MENPGFANDTLNRAFNRILEENPDIAAAFGGGSQARYRYHRPSNPHNQVRAQDMYFYTTHRINHKGRKLFVSGIYRYRAKDKSWRPMKQAGHRRRKDADARAKRLAQANA